MRRWWWIIALVWFVASCGRLGFDQEIDTRQPLGASALRLSEQDPFDFGATLAGENPNHVFTVFHLGLPNPATVTAISVTEPFHFVGGTYPGTGGNCADRIEHDCTIVVEFAAKALGEAVGQLRLRYRYDGEEFLTRRNLIGVGIGPNLNWRRTGPEHWPDYKKELDRQASRGSAGTATYRVLGAAYRRPRWQGTIVAEDQHLYSVAEDSTGRQLLQIDPVLLNQEKIAHNFVGPVVLSNGFGTALANNGKIIAAPSDGIDTFVFDPTSPANYRGAKDNPTGSSRKWFGTVAAPNGKLYGIPSDSLHVIEIDPDNPENWRLVGPPLTKDSVGSNTAKWLGGVLAPNGKIYGIPNRADFILEIDPNNLETIGPVGPNLTVDPYTSQTHKWAGGVLAGNGNIYGIPEQATQVLEIIPTDIERSGTFGTRRFGTGKKWFGGALAANGNIYSPPCGEDEGVFLLEIDPSQRTIDLLGPANTATPGAKCVGATLAPNGKIYSAPWQSDQFIEIDPKSNGTLPMDVVLSGYFNKL